ncbi:MAG: winged helix-turn-helix domain-containing protein [Bacteroidales bacterium]
MIGFYEKKELSFEIKGAFAIYKNKEIFWGESQHRLLIALIAERSINAAAKKCNMSYQQAWTIADRLNRLSPIPILIKHKGGKDGGGCLVSAYGKELIRLYERKTAEFNQYISSMNMDIDKCLL